METFYPQVLEHDEHVNFRLKCRIFIEMIRQGAEMQNPSCTNGTKKWYEPGHTDHWGDAINLATNPDTSDDLDTQFHWDKMDIEGVEQGHENGSDKHMESYQTLLEKTLREGQKLQAEFKDDPRREVSKALEEAFSLMAYQDPLNASEVAHLLDPSGRVAVAEEVNSAILREWGHSEIGTGTNMVLLTRYKQIHLANPPPPPSRVSYNKPLYYWKTFGKMAGPEHS